MSSRGHTSGTPGVGVTNPVSVSSGRDWSSHSKLTKLFKPDATVAITKKIKTLLNFYQEAPRNETKGFNRDCYSLVYRLILDALHHYNILYVNQQGSGGLLVDRGADGSTGKEKSSNSSSNSSSKDSKDEKIDLDHIKSILGIFKKLLDDAAGVFRAKWQNRSIKNLLLQLVMHSNEFAIRTRGLQLILAYLDIFALTHQSSMAVQAPGEPPSSTSSSVIVSDLATVLRDVVDLRPFCMETSSLLSAKPVMEWMEYLNHGMLTSGRNTVFPFLESTKNLNAQEGFNCNLHIFDAILNYILHQPAEYVPQEGLTHAAALAQAARAQCAHFRFWFDVLKQGVFTYLYPTVAEKMGLSNVAPTAATSASTSATTDSASSSASSGDHTAAPLPLPLARCVGFRPMCPLSLHIVVVTWLLKAFQMPSSYPRLGSSAVWQARATIGGSSNTILNELCNDPVNLQLIMEIFRQTFILLPIRYASIIHDILELFSHWVRGEYITPVIFQSMQHMLTSMMDHVFPAFCLVGCSAPPEDQTDDEHGQGEHDDGLLANGSSGNGAGGFLRASHAYRTQLKLCGLVIQFYTLISQEPFVILNEPTWEHLLVTLLNATNYLVKMGQFDQAAATSTTTNQSARASPPPGMEDSHGYSQNGLYSGSVEGFSTMEHLINPLLSCLFDCYLRSCISINMTPAPAALSIPITLGRATSAGGVNGDSSLLMKGEMESKIRSWLHGNQSSSGSSKAVIEAWKRKLLSLTKNLLDVLASVTSEESLARPRAHHEAPSASRSNRPSLNPVMHGHRVGSVAAISTHHHAQDSQSNHRQQSHSPTPLTTTDGSGFPVSTPSPTPLFSSTRKHRSSSLESRSHTRTTIHEDVASGSGEQSRSGSIGGEEHSHISAHGHSSSSGGAVDDLHMEGRWGAKGAVGHTGALSFMDLPRARHASIVDTSAYTTTGIKSNASPSSPHGHAHRMSYDDSMLPSPQSPPFRLGKGGVQSASGTSLPVSNGVLSGTSASLTTDPSVLKGLQDFNESFRTWLHFLRLIGHPHLITDPASKRIAWKGIVESLLLLINMVSRPVTSKKAQLQAAAALLQTQSGGISAAMAESMDLPIDLARKFLPQGKTLLHIFGPLLFEACYESSETGGFASSQSNGFPAGSPALSGLSGAASLTSSPMLSGSASPSAFVGRIRSVYTLTAGYDTSGVRAMGLAALACIFCTRTSSIVPPEFLTAFIFHIRCGFASNASHLDWTLLKQCRSLFSLSHMLPGAWVLLPEFMKAVAVWSTPLSIAQKERDEAIAAAKAEQSGSGSVSATNASTQVKKKKRDGLASLTNSPRRRSATPSNIGGGGGGASGNAPRSKRRIETPMEVRSACLSLLFSWLSLPYAYGTAPIVTMPPLPSSSSSLGPAPFDLGESGAPTSGPGASSRQTGGSFSLKQGPSFSSTPSHALLQSIPRPHLGGVGLGEADSTGGFARPSVGTIDSPRTPHASSQSMLDALLVGSSEPGSLGPSTSVSPSPEVDLSGSAIISSSHPLSSSDLITKSPVPLVVDETAEQRTIFANDLESARKHRASRSNPSELGEFVSQQQNTATVDSAPSTTGSLSKSSSLSQSSSVDSLSVLLHGGASTIGAGIPAAHHASLSSTTSNSPLGTPKTLVHSSLANTLQGSYPDFLSLKHDFLFLLRRALTHENVTDQSKIRVGSIWGLYFLVVEEIQSFGLSPSPAFAPCELVSSMCTQVLGLIVPPVLPPPSPSSVHHAPNSIVTAELSSFLIALHLQAQTAIEFFGCLANLADQLHQMEWTENGVSQSLAMLRTKILAPNPGSAMFQPAATPSSTGNSTAEVESKPDPFLSSPFNTQPEIGVTGSVAFTIVESLCIVGEEMIQHAMQIILPVLVPKFSPTPSHANVTVSPPTATFHASPAASVSGTFPAHVPQAAANRLGISPGMGIMSPPRSVPATRPSSSSVTQASPEKKPASGSPVPKSVAPAGPTYIVPSFLATPLRKEYLDLYSKLLHQLLFCLLEWMMGSTALQSVLFDSTGQDSSSPVDGRLRTRVFRFLNACMTMLPDTQQRVRELQIRAQTGPISTLATPPVGAPSVIRQQSAPHDHFHHQPPERPLPQLPQGDLPTLHPSFVASCVAISDAASIVLRHCVNRVHHFPVRCASHEDRGSFIPNVTGLLLSTVSEENDPVGDPASPWIIQTQLCVTDESVNVQIVPCSTSLDSASSDETPRLHFIYADNVLLTLYERPQWNDASHSLSSTTIRLVVRDLTGKYVYDFSPVEEGISAWNFHSLRSQLLHAHEPTPSSIRAAGSVNPSLLLQSVEQVRRRKFAELEAEWNREHGGAGGITVQPPSHTPDIGLISPTTDSSAGIEGSSEDSSLDPNGPIFTRRRSGRVVEPPAPQATVSVGAPIAVPEGGSFVDPLGVNAAPSAAATDSVFKSLSDQETNDTAFDDPDEGDEDSEDEDHNSIEGAVSPVSQFGSPGPEGEANQGQNATTMVGGVSSSSHTTDSGAVEFSPEFLLSSSQDPLEQVFSFLHSNFSEDELLVTETKQQEQDRVAERIKANMEKESKAMAAATTPAKTKDLSVHPHSSTVPASSPLHSPPGAATTTQHARGSVFSPGASTAHSTAHGVHSSQLPDNEPQEGGSVLFVDMSTLKIDEDTFAGGFTTTPSSTAHGEKHDTPGSAKKKPSGGLSNKARKLMGIGEDLETEPVASHTLLFPSSADSPSSTRDAVSPFDFARSLVMRVYVGLDRLPLDLNSTNVKANKDASTQPGLSFLEDSVKLRRSLKLLDTNPSRECHKIGVLYVGPAQDTQKAVLSNEIGSSLYESFVGELGSLVPLIGHVGFLGGLDPRSTGSHSRYWCSSTTEIMWHVVTLMPSKSVDQDEQQIAKKRQVGNDHVHVVWSEYERDYRPSTIPSQFNDVHIVIYPMAITGLFRISIHCKGSVPSFGPLQDGMVVRRCHLGHLVRLTALNANRAIRYATPGFGRPEPTRRKYIEDIITKHHHTQTNSIDALRTIIMPMIAHTPAQTQFAS